MNTNIDYWNKIVENPSKAYAALLKEEALYLQRTIDKNEKVLDVGCGDGRNIFSILEITKNITGIDFDPQAIKRSKNNLKNHPEVELLEASAFDLPFADAIFDISILSMTLVNLENKKTDALLEMKRVTKKDGKIILSVYSEKAKEERLRAYANVGLPIQEIKGSTFFFDGEFGANTSEQFSINEIEDMVSPLGLKIIEYTKVSHLAYLLTLSNK